MHPAGTSHKERAEKAEIANVGTHIEKDHAGLKQGN
jgi:hypothetical protein